MQNGTSVPEPSNHVSLRVLALSVSIGDLLERAGTGASGLQRSSDRFLDRDSAGVAMIRPDTLVALSALHPDPSVEVAQAFAKSSPCECCEV